MEVKRECSRKEIFKKLDASINMTLEAYNKDKTFEQNI